MVLKSSHYVFKMSIFKKLSIVLYRKNWCMYIFILKSEVQTSSSRVSTSSRVSNRFSTRLNLYCIQSSTDTRRCVSSSSTGTWCITRSTNIMDSIIHDMEYWMSIARWYEIDFIEYDSLSSTATRMSKRKRNHWVENRVNRNLSRNSTRWFWSILKD